MSVTRNTINTSMSTQVSAFGSKSSKATSKLRSLRKVIAFARRAKGIKVLLSKRERCAVITPSGENRTPKLLSDYEYLPIEEGQQNALNVILGMTSSTTNIAGSVPTGAPVDVSFSTQPITSTIGSVTQSLMATQLDLSADVSSLRISTTAEPQEEVIKFGFPIHPRIKRKLLSKVVITIKETPTFFLLDRPSYTAEQDSEEGRLITDDNLYYEYVTVGKGRFRKVNSTEAQTMDLIRKSRMTMAKTTSKRTNSTFVSEWDVYDTYKDMELVSKISDDNAEKRNKSVQDSGFKVSVTASEIEDMNLSPEEQFESIAKSEAFLDACAKMERLLASNVYRDQQKTFRGLMQPDPFRLDVEFRYRMVLLWSFTSDYVRGRTVTGMCWNSLNTDLLAVGYGKYFYQDRRNGLVCCWTIKNPTQPERKYKFDSPVTSVNFSTDRPNLLACGFCNGSVIILDISSRSKTIIAVSNRETSPSYEPIWQIFWFHGDDYHKNEEQLMTCCQDGRICRYRREKTLNCFPMMWVSRMEGKVKGIDQSRKCRAHDIPVSRHPAALVLTRHPVDTLTYFVGTDEGCIHKCSTNYLHHHMDIILAHNGPVYSMQFSPFCSKIFLTSGADWYIRIWTEDIGQPLLTLSTSMEAVQSAAWSPVNATIIASISGNGIHFWDIRRKIFVPASSTTTPTDAKNLMLQFTSSGLNLVVGDGHGAVHVYGLKDMPFSPFYQEVALVQAIKKALVTRPDLLKMLKKIGKPFY